MAIFVLCLRTGTKLILTGCTGLKTGAFPANYGGATGFRLGMTRMAIFTWATMRQMPANVAALTLMYPYSRMKMYWTPGSHPRCGLSVRLDGRIKLPV